MGLVNRDSTAPRLLTVAGAVESFYKGGMDALDKEIEARRRERARLVEKIRALDVTVSALERASALRPADSAESAKSYQAGIVQRQRSGDVDQSLISGGASPGLKKGGRKPGDINKEWRGVLEFLYGDGSPQKYDQIILAVEMCGMMISDASVRDRIRNLVRTGLMSGDAKGGFIVTENAAERFGFAKGNGPSEDGSDENAGGAETPPAFKLQPSPDGA